MAPTGWRQAALGACVAFAALATPVAGERADTESVLSAAARFDYLLHCSGCHRPDGTGEPPEVPSLRGPMGALVATPQGRAYIARVPEVAQAPISDEALARLLNWVLYEFNAETLPADFRLLDSAEVAAARVQVLTDPLRTRAEIVGSYDD